MSEHTVAHRVLDELNKFETRIGGIVSSIAKTQQELLTKYNELAAQDAQAAHIIQRIITSNLASADRSIRGLDMNVLALAEMVKEIIGQLTQTDFLFGKLHAALADTPGVVEVFAPRSDAELTQIKVAAEKWFKDLLSASFQIVQERIQLAEEEAARAHAEQTASNKTTADSKEKDKIETELKNAAAAERTVTSNPSGGPGTTFPEGAEIFGG